MVNASSSTLLWPGLEENGTVQYMQAIRSRVLHFQLRSIDNVLPSYRSTESGERSRSAFCRYREATHPEFNGVVKNELVY